MIPQHAFRVLCRFERMVTLRLLPLRRIVWTTLGQWVLYLLVPVVALLPELLLIMTTLTLAVQPSFLRTEAT